MFLGPSKVRPRGARIPPSFRRRPEVSFFEDRAPVILGVWAAPASLVLAHRTYLSPASTTDTPGTMVRDPPCNMVWHQSPPCPAPARRPRPDLSPWSGSACGGLQVIALGPPKAVLGCGSLRGPGRHSPPDQWVGRPRPRPKTQVAVTKMWRLRPMGSRRPAPGCGCPIPAARGDRLPACPSPVDRPHVAEGPLRGTR